MKEQLAQESIFNAATYVNNFWNTIIFPNVVQLNSVYSRDNLLKNVKDGWYIINLGEYAIIGTHRITYSIENNKVTYFNSFRVENISNKIWKFTNNKNIIIWNIFRIKVYDNV